MLGHPELSHSHRTRTADILVAVLSICSAQKLVDSSCTKCMGVTMKHQILIPVILGLHSSILMGEAKQVCPDIEEVWKGVRVQWNQTSETQSYKGWFEFKGNWHFSHFIHDIM